MGVLLLAAPALAHAPRFAADNASPATATVVANADQSWAVYDRLGRAEVAYYRFTLEPGERLRVSTFTPVGGAFTPSVVLMSRAGGGGGGGSGAGGSGASGEGSSVPPGVVVPQGMTAEVVAGERPARPELEPFTPMALFETTSLDRPVTAETTYLVAVYEPAGRPGPVGVAIGTTEAFTATGYLGLPFDLVRVHRWAGQPWWLVLGPTALTLIAGLGWALSRRPEEANLPLVRGGLLAAGLLVLGSALGTALQLGLALARTGPTPLALVTLGYVATGLVAGWWVVWVARRVPLGLTWRSRVGLGLAAVAALVVWAGFVVGPAAALVVAVTPNRWLEG